MSLPRIASRALLLFFLTVFGAGEIHAQDTCDFVVPLAIYHKDGSRDMWLKCQEEVPGAVLYEVERAVNVGGDPDPSFDPLGTILAPETRTIDHDVNDQDEYTYRMRACYAASVCGEWVVSKPENARLIWPFVEKVGDGFEAEFFEVHDAFNEVIAWATGQEASDGSDVVTGYHEGVDMNRSQVPGARTKVLAPVAGLINRRSGDDSKDQGHLAFQVAVDYDPATLALVWETLSFSHLTTATAKGGSGNGIPAELVRGKVIRSGDFIADIGDKGFFGILSDHTHVGLENIAIERDSRPFLALYQRDKYRDPKLRPPNFIDENGDGKVVLFRDHSIPRFWNPLPWEDPSYIDYDDSNGPILSGDIAIHVEVMDEQGTDPRVAPNRVGYWIEGPRDAEKDDDDVRSSENPYVLFDFGPRSDLEGDAYFFGGKPIEEPPVECWDIADISDIANAGCPLGGPSYCQKEDPEEACPVNVLFDPPGSNNVYKYPVLHHYIVTNARDSSGRPASVDRQQHWRTNAKEGASGSLAFDANYAGKPEADKASEARFPDGEYRLGVYMADAVHEVTRFAPVNGTAGAPELAMRLENFAPIIEEVDIYQDADGDPAESALWLGSCEKPLYEYEYPGPVHDYPGARHLSLSKREQINFSGGCRICVRIRFSEGMDRGPRESEFTLWADGTPLGPLPLLDGSWSTKYSTDDEWTGIYALGCKESDFSIEDEVQTSLTALSLWAQAHDLEDNEGYERGLDIADNGSGRLDATDTHHRYVLDEDAPTASHSIQLRQSL